MAVAEMSVMTLIGLEADKNAILERLSRTSAVQIRSCSEREFIEKQSGVEAEDVSALLARVESAVEAVVAQVNALKKDERPAVAADGFGITRDEFFAVDKRREELDGIVAEIEKLLLSRAEIAVETAKLKTEIKAFEPYLGLKEQFDFYKNTKKTIVKLGTAPKDKAAKLIVEAAETGIAAEALVARPSETVVALISHVEDKEALESLLSQAGFRACAFSGETTAEKETERLNAKINELGIKDEGLKKDLLAFAEKIKDLKLYADYLGFLKEKTLAENLIGKTEKTFLLEAYVPTEAVEAVKKAISETTEAVFTEFEVVPRDEFAPTLNRNGKVVENFEVVTNMYSSPAYGALDPNAVMSFFFSLFMGVIMADVGYGLLMLIGGLVLGKMKRKGTSLHRMAIVFAVGGIFAIIFGAVFDGIFGFQLLHKIFGEDSAYSAFYAAHLDQIKSMAVIPMGENGINVPAILMWCLALGTAQLAVGLLMKAAQDFTRKKFLEGIFGGVVWAIGLFAAIGWVFCMIKNIQPLGTYFMYAAIGGIGVGVLTAGVGERGIAIVTKPFTAAYGIINYVSDILSYARLYGLMLSGSQIASIFTNTLAIGMLFPQGPVGIIFGIILIIIGNVFNLAINLLGAYIHDARLQYVEFYGKFYEGEGELFTPFGNSLKHSYFEK